MKRFLTTSVTLSLLLCPFARGEDSPSPTTQPTAGTFEFYHIDGTEKEKQFKALLQGDESLADSNPKRGEVAQNAIPLLKQVLVDLDGMAQTKQEYVRAVVPYRDSTQAQLFALGDTDTVSTLDAAGKLPGPDGIRAKRVLLQAHWFKAGQDSEKVSAALAETDQLATAQPADVQLTMELGQLGKSTKDPAVKKHMVDLLANTMHNNVTKAVIRQLQNEDKKFAVEGKPMVLAGKLPDGKDFTTADWKGKVVLVDFWAAWCGPCKAELPRVQRMYNQYHDKGFEVLGVDNDQSASAVIGYSAKANLPWPQLFDSAAAAKGAWNPITVAYGIDGIPVMFLIDKKGVCRSVKARDDFEKLIPQMLAE